MQVIYICKATFLITAFYNVPILVIALVTLKNFVRRCSVY